MSKKQAKKVRALGKVLFVLYIGFLIYFLFLSDWYGREGVMEEYRYNLELFKEIRRFIVYREQLGVFVVFSNLFGNILIFMPFGFFISMASRSSSFFMALFNSLGLSLCVEVLQAGCILYAYLARGAAAGVVGGIAVVSMVLSIMGIRAAVKGFRERERNYLTCKIGLPGSTLVLLLFLAIFIGGLS